MTRASLPVFLLCTLPLAADWPRFRGPNGSGVSDTAGLPAQFGPAKNVVWKSALPPGHSSPILSGERIFVTAFEGEKLYTFCLSRDSGKILWRRECPRARRERLDSRNSPASPTPVADGRHVYVFFPDYGLLSYDFEGVERWRTPLGPFNNLYGMGASPVLAGDRVVLVCDQSSQSFAAAYDAKTGRMAWKTARPEALSGHSTPIVYQPSEGPAQILAPGSFRMDVYSAATGAIVWQARGLASEMKSVPVLNGETVYVSGFNTPENDPGRQVTILPFEEVLAKHDADGDGRISLKESPDERTRKYFPYIDLDHDGYMDASEWKLYAASSAAENGLLAFKIGGGDPVWKYQKAIPQLPSALLYRGVLYMINDAGVLTTLDPGAGSPHKQARLRGVADRYFASPVAGDGKVFIVSHSGVATVLKAGPEQEILAVNELDEECYATPAIDGGRIYVRTRSALYCFGLAGAKP